MIQGSVCCTCRDPRNVMRGFVFRAGQRVRGKGSDVFYMCQDMDKMLNGIYLCVCG